MDAERPQRLRRLRDLLAAEQPPAAPGTPAARALERLEHDLLPRTAGSAPHLVVGIVGPNNAGKSALFNALVEETLSPSLPTGGATRALVGAMHPDLVAALRAEPTLSRFPLRELEPGPEGLAAALETNRDAREVLLVVREGLRPDLALIDTPDFDSVLVANRRASESLLSVVDLALVVVTRHTYQNREVVSFLQDWLAHGRPWMLVYNESLGEEVTREHAAKLASDVGHVPLALFHAPFDLSLQQGTARLAPTAIGPSLPGRDPGGALRVSDGAPAAGMGLREWLFEGRSVDGLKQRALAASLASLADELAQHVVRLGAEGRQARELERRALDLAAPVGRRIASHAMPVAPFLDAFRVVLDRRPGIGTGRVRSLLRGSRLWIEQALAKLRSQEPAPSDAATKELAAVEREALFPAWPEFFESLGAELAPGGTWWRREDTPHAPDEVLEACLTQDLAPGSSGPSRERAGDTLASDEDVLLAFGAACEQLIEEQLSGRRDEWLMQLAVDATHLFPAAVAGFVIFHTGGLGADVAVGGAGALSSVFAERISRLLGTEVAAAARERWTRLRGERVAQVLVEAALERAAPELARRASECEQRAKALTHELEGLTCEPNPLPVV